MADGKRPHLLRRKYLIYPRFQLTLIAVNFVIMLGVLLVVAIQAFRSHEKFREMGRLVGLDAAHTYFKFIDYQADYIYLYLAIAMAIGFILSFTLTLIISHKLAGPLVRLRKYFEHISQTGEVTALSFRKGDFLTDLPPLVNGALERIKAK